MAMMILPVIAHFILSTAITLLTLHYFGATAQICLIGMAATLLFGFWFWKRQNKEKPMNGQDNFLNTCLLPIVLGVLGNFFFSWLIMVIGVPKWTSNTTQQQLLSGSVFWKIAGLSIFVPLSEELVFRCLSYRAMRSHLPVWTAMICNAMLFAVYHGNLRQMFYAFPMGILLTFVYEKSGNWKAPVLLHMAANMSTVLLTI